MLRDDHFRFLENAVDGARSVPLRSVSAGTSGLGPFHHALACLAAAAWDKPRSACQRLTPAPAPKGLKFDLAIIPARVAKSNLPVLGLAQL